MTNPSNDGPTLADVEAQIDDLFGNDGTTATSENLTGSPEDATFTSGSPEVELEPEGGDSDFYRSARDLDGDGHTDTVHSNAFGIDQIEHLDTDGNVTTVELDMDGNGTYESVVQSEADGSSRVHLDMDDDGNVDFTSHFDAQDNLVQDDIVVDGIVRESHRDTDGDGTLETTMVDTTGNGQFDTAVIDSDGDDIPNTVVVDTNGDGMVDLQMEDTTNDGVLNEITYSSGAEDFGAVDEPFAADDLV
ncbi:hypothetical protein [Rhodococcus sp. NPDC049939]|uniref:hypothetical protein n=1 Tax=Rhodococcus sp. NPDC049939 TaxID=3155511 RepID=UPI0033C98C9C